MRVSTVIGFVFYVTCVFTIAIFGCSGTSLDNIPKPIRDRIENRPDKCAGIAEGESVLCDAVAQMPGLKLNDISTMVRNIPTVVAIRYRKDPEELEKVSKDGIAFASDLIDILNNDKPITGTSLLKYIKTNSQEKKLYILLSWGLIDDLLGPQGVGDLPLTRLDKDMIIEDMRIVIDKFEFIRSIA